MSRHRAMSGAGARRQWAGTAPAADPGIADAPEHEIYRVLDWLAERQDAIEATLAARHLTSGASDRPRSMAGLVEALTSRELEVLRLIADGRANREIARDLFVTLDTVKKHISHILDKLAASSRTHAVARAREFGLIP